MIIVPANTLAAGGFSVDNSCRFNKADSAHMQKTLGSGNTDVFTISMWVKRGVLGEQHLFRSYAASDDFCACRFEGSNVLKFYQTSGGFNLTTNQVFRDVGAWYHIMYSVDTGQGTAGNRVKLYVNGTRVTSFSTETQPDEDSNIAINTTNHVLYVGSDHAPSTYFDGYMAEVVFLDGTAAANTDLGEFDSDSPTIWKPVDPSALTFGTSGFYLDFKDSANLGNDANGGTDLAETNFAAADQATDTPTNNFCVMNPLDNYFAAGTFSEGNCKVVTNASNTTWGTSTFGLSAGKWYFEVKFEGTLGGGENAGIVDRVTGATSQKAYNASGGKNAVWRSGGDLYVDDSNDTDFTPGGGDLWASDDILGVFLDLDNNKIYCAINGSIIISGAGADITAVASTLNNAYFIIAGDSNTASTNFEFNFGGCSAFAISSAVSDSNGYGNFEFSPNQGGASNFDSAAKNFLAICTKNLGSDGG